MLLADSEDKFINPVSASLLKPSPELIAYIQSMMRNGYTQLQIRDYLLRSGYQQYDIDAAFSQLTQQQAITPAPRQSWLWIAGAVLGLGVGGILVAFLFAAPAAMTLSASPSQVDVRAGEMLAVTDSFKGDGTVSVTHTITNPTTSAPLTTPAAEQLSVKGTAERTFSIPIPASATPGRYVVDVLALDQKGRKLTTSFPINVLAPKATCFDGIQNQGETAIDCGGPCQACPEVQQPAAVNVSTPPIDTETPRDCPGGCNDYDPTTTDTCDAGTCVHTPKPSVCGNGVCNGDETSQTCPQDCGAGPDAPSADSVIEDAKNAAAEDPDRASGLCNALPRPQDKDRCYAVVASNAGRSDLCAAITEDITRDQCYIDFALSKNEFDVCEKIVNRYLRGSCNSLRNLRELEKQRSLQAAGTQCAGDRPSTCDDADNPVCGSDAQTYGNECKACMNTAVASYTTGACQ